MPYPRAKAIDQIPAPIFRNFRSERLRRRLANLARYTQNFGMKFRKLSVLFYSLPSRNFRNLWSNGKRPKRLFSLESTGKITFPFPAVFLLGPTMHCTQTVRLAIFCRGRYKMSTGKFKRFEQHRSGFNQSFVTCFTLGIQCCI